MQSGIRVGGLDTPNGKAVVQALRVALNEALRRGQNDVAKAIAADLASLGGASNINITGNVIQTKP